MEPFEADGVVYQLQLSRKSSTGYLCVVEERPGEFHAKGTFVKGGGQVFLPGGACKTAQDAALETIRQALLNGQAV